MEFQVKKIFALLLLLTLSVSLSAQTPAAYQLAEMKKLDFLVGQWSGDGWIEIGRGQRRTFTINENVQRKVDGLVLLIEGLGKSKIPGQPDEVIVHNAFAVLSYDLKAKLFRWRAFRATGDAIDTEARVTGKILVWEFKDDRAGNIRFTITLTEKGQWFEIGEYSRDGTTWQKFFEMTLRRVT